MDHSATPSLEQQTIRRITRRLIPFLIVLFVVAFLDRTNVGFAALRMNEDIGISQATYGLGAGIFFLGYFVFEVPSNILLHRFGARVWIARIMITWGLVAAAMGFLQSATHFVVLRVLLGVAEAGFFPGMIFLLSLWFPNRYRARIFAMFYLGVPISQVIGAPLSVGLMQLGEHVGVVGWRLMYIAEGLPAIALGIACLFYLTNRPADAHWLSEAQRHWLTDTLAREERAKPLAVGAHLSKRQMVAKALCNPQVWLMAFVYFGITSGSNAMNFFLPTVLQSFRATFGLELGLMQNGLLTAVPYALAALCMILWSRHSDRHQERHWHAGGAALLAAASIALALVINQPWVIVIGFTLLAIGVYSAINVFWAVPGQALTGVGAAAGIGLINSIGNLSGFTGPYITGLLFSTTGSYTPGFLIIAALVAAGGVGMLVLPRGMAHSAQPGEPLHEGKA
ncbi:MFS transporter [Pseudomonas typographi]|uniref:MFS transporter n=1 Tax=Pseudomonas typographi TaxID=2715964 RepID=A0ABR7ZAC4_9PSED|nr:MFS transporter [Pseudomonas typographi]MBD1553920.1 MFS transporter [Pseudomonas typographi]MBD1589678.1 MFS transporter [Pseudomonas typographi]MBD1602328.1 MFS transporter [Pseudomonas typographi]